MKKTLALILAAGKGSRMKSESPKPLVDFIGQPIVSHIINSFRNAQVKDIALVVGYKSGEVIDKLGPEQSYIHQKEQNGTADAVRSALPFIIENKYDDVFIFVGDTPLIKPDTIEHLYSHHIRTDAACTFLTADFPIPFPYARIIRDENNKLYKCVEEHDASEAEKEIQELLSSHFIFNAKALIENLHKIELHPKNKEYYLTDIINILLKQGLTVEALKTENYFELTGLNTPEDLKWAKNLKLLQHG